MAKDYHGPVPVTPTDIAMAKTHLQDTLKMKKAELNMNLQKIADHSQAASATNDPASQAYNQGHIEGHVKDNKAIQKVIDDRQTSMKTINNLKPVPVGMAEYIGKKKLGASNMAKMAAGDK